MRRTNRRTAQRQHARRDAGAPAYQAQSLGRIGDAVAVRRPPGSHEEKTTHATEQDRPDVAQAREAWFAAQPNLDPERPIFTAETGLSARMARLGGRCARGQCLRSGSPHGHWLTTIFVAGSAPVGMSAPMLLDGPMTRDWFLGCCRADARPNPQARRHRHPRQPESP